MSGAFLSPTSKYCEKLSIRILEFLVGLDVAFQRRSSERAVSDRKSLEKLEFGGP
jgi:hypothetical protein